eukprot:2462340-Prymnesium_polylepis.2
MALLDPRAPPRLARPRGPQHGGAVHPRRHVHGPLRFARARLVAPLLAHLPGDPPPLGHVRALPRAHRKPAPRPPRTPQ